MPQAIDSIMAKSCGTKMASLTKSQLFKGPLIYRQVSNIRCTLVGNKIVDHSGAVGASPVGAAPITSSFSAQHLASIDYTKATARRHFKFGNLVHLILEILRYMHMYTGIQDLVLIALVDW